MRGEGKPRDIWTKLEVIGKLLGSFVMAGAMIWVATLGKSIETKLHDSERTSRRIEFIGSHQLGIAQMQSQALDAVGRHIIDKVKPDFGKVAFLAGLHSAYGDYFDTRAIMEGLADEVENPEARRELRRLAQRVARRQVEDLLRQGGRHAVMVFEIQEGRSPSKRIAFEEDAGVHEIEVRVFEPDIAGDVLDRVRVEVQVLTDGAAEMKRFGPFDLSYFDLPLWDRLRLVHEPRAAGPGNEEATLHYLALLLQDAAEEDGRCVVRIEAVHFPEGFHTPGDLRDEVVKDLAMELQGGATGTEHTH